MKAGPKGTGLFSLVTSGLSAVTQGRDNVWNDAEQAGKRLGTFLMGQILRIADAGVYLRLDHC